jgi:MFS family permease
MHKRAVMPEESWQPATFGFALAANALFFFSFQTVFPVLPRFIADVVLQQPPDVVGGQVGLATTVLALVAVVTRIPAGQFADRWGRRRFLFLGAVCFAVAPLIYALSHGMPLLVLGRVIQGIGLATFSTAFVAFVTELAPSGRRGQALGLAGASTSVAFITAPLVGDWVAVNSGYVSVFLMSAATAAISVLFVALTSTSSQRRLGQDRFYPRLSNHRSELEIESRLDLASGVRSVLAQSGVRAGVLTMAALGIPFGAFITFLPLFATERDIAGVGLVFSVYAITVFVIQPWAGSFTDRVGRLRTILPGLIINGFGAVILALDGSLAVFALAGVTFGIGGGLVRGGVDPLVQDSVPLSLRGTAAAVQYTSFDFWIGAGSLPIGLLANVVGYAISFAATGVFCMLGAVGLAMMLQNDKSEEHKPFG